MTDNRYGNNDSAPWEDPLNNSENTSEQGTGDAAQETGSNNNTTGAPDTSQNPWQSQNPYTSSSQEGGAGQQQSPYGAGYGQSANGQQQQQNPYGGASQGLSSSAPYGQPSQNPYGAPQQGGAGQQQSPYGAGYGQSANGQQQQQNPYGGASQGLSSSAPYGQPSQNPYGAPQQSQPPVSSSSTEQSSNPYGASQPSSQQPFGAPQGQSSYQTGAEQGYPAPPSYGATSYSQSSYGVPAATQPVGAGGVNPILNVPMVTRESGLEIMQAIRYGFKATFARPLLWILGTLLVLLPSFISGVIQGFQSASYPTDAPSVVPSVFELVIYAVYFFLAPFLTSALLVQLDGQEVTLDTIKARLKYPQVLLVTFLAGLCSAIPWVVYIFVISSSASSASTVEETLGVIVLSTIVVSLVSLLLGIFISLATYLAVDGQAFGFAAIVNSCKLVARAYLPFLGFMILMGLISGFGSFITCGVGALVFVPATLHAYTHAYRQMAHLPYPAA